MSPSPPREMDTVLPPLLIISEIDTILPPLLPFVIPSNHQVPTSNHTFLLPAVRVTLLPPSSSSFSQLQLLQWTDHTVFFTSFTPSVNAPGDQQAEARGASTFHHGGLFGVYSQLASPPSLPLHLLNYPGFLPGLLAMPLPTSGRE